MKARTCCIPLFGATLLAGLAVLTGCSPRNASLVAAQNKSATLSGDIPFHPLQGRVITSWIDRRDSTMSTLYGNDVAVQHARTNEPHNYPPGALLAAVTWKQQEDPRWFGARIPATAQSVEYVTVKSAPDGKPSYLYQLYTGTPLKETASAEGAVPSERASWLLSQRAAVMP